MQCAGTYGKSCSWMAGHSCQGTKVPNTTHAGRMPFASEGAMPAERPRRARALRWFSLRSRRGRSRPKRPLTAPSSRAACCMCCRPTGRHCQSRRQSRSDLPSHTSMFLQTQQYIGRPLSPSWMCALCQGQYLPHRWCQHTTICAGL